MCSFTIAVNRRKSQPDQPDADFFRITAWRQLGDLCQKYLTKGRKVAVTGSVHASAYQGKDGTAKASLEVTAEDVEFLTPKGDSGSSDNSYTPPIDSMPVNQEPSNGFTQISDEEMPF